MKGFNRIVYYGDTSEGQVVAVETTEEKTLLYLFLGKELKQKKEINGWQRKGHIVAGSDGARVWVFDPDKNIVYVP